MYALVNTMDRWESHIGTIMSLHRSEEAAEAANSKHQRLVRKNSPGSYLPTTVVPLVKGRYRRGQMLHSSDVA